MPVEVQKSINTTLPRSAAAVSGGELIHSTAPSSAGSSPSIFTTLAPLRHRTNPAQVAAASERLASLIDPSTELRVECDLGFQHLGDGAIALGIAGDTREFLLPDFRDLRAQRERRTADPEPLRSIGLERDRGF